jgi:hypothetical protein
MRAIKMSDRQLRHNPTKLTYTQLPSDDNREDGSDFSTPLASPRKTTWPKKPQDHLPTLPPPQLACVRFGYPQNHIQVKINLELGAAVNEVGAVLQKVTRNVLCTT